MTGIRVLSSTPCVQPTAAKPDGNVVSSGATANFPTVMRDHHQKLMASMESAKAGRPADRPEVLLSLSRRPDIEAMIERQHAARRTASRTKDAARSCADENEDDAVPCSDRDGDPVRGGADRCGSGVDHLAQFECEPKDAAPLMALVTSFFAWYSPAAATAANPTSRALTRRRRRPQPGDRHGASQGKADVDGDGK